jgi:hypothetical protein
LSTPAGHRQFLDWAELPVAEPSGLLNLRYLYALQLAHSLARQLGKTADRRRWQAWRDRLSAAIGRAFQRQEQWYDTLRGASQSQHMAAFLILTQLVTGVQAEELLDEAVRRSLEDKDRPDSQKSSWILMSPYMHYYLFEALAQWERVDDIRAIIQARWSCWLDLGAQTTWENWEIEFADGSPCHGWSAHPLLYLAHAGNIPSR